MQYLHPLLFITCGLGLIALGAHWFVEGTTAFSARLKIPPMIAGLVVVGMATSAPELMVSLVAALEDHASVAVGNAVGSNIANLGLVLGVATLIRTAVPPPGVLCNTYLLMLVGTLVGALLLWDLQLSRPEGIVMLVALAAAIAQAVRSTPRDELTEETTGSSLKAGWARILLSLAGGLALLLLGSSLLVDSAVQLARLLGVSDLIIGLTIVAVGTSLPELAAAIAAALKGRVELIIGNILGSNLFNILGIVGVCALLAPGPQDPLLATRDLPLLLGFSVLVGVLLRRPLRRPQGLLLLGGFIAYQTFLWLDTGGPGT